MVLLLLLLLFATSPIRVARTRIGVHSIRNDQVYLWMWMCVRLYLDLYTIATSFAPFCC